MDELLNIVLSLPAHTDLKVAKSNWQLPRGVVRTLGNPRGQRADWEITLKDGRRIHIVEFEEFYKIHWDFASPHENPIAHLRMDARHWYDVLVDTLQKLKRAVRK